MLFQNNNIFEENTFKQYYYTPLSPDEESNDKVIIVEKESPKFKRKREQNKESLDEFFEFSKNKKKKLCSSSVSRAHPDGGTAYISTNTDDGSKATHLIKIEIYDVKKLSKIPPTLHWKHASVRMKYYTDEANKNFKCIKNIVYNATKEISESDFCKKFHFNNSEQ